MTGLGDALVDEGALEVGEDEDEDDGGEQARKMNQRSSQTTNTFFGTCRSPLSPA